MKATSAGDAKIDSPSKGGVIFICYRRSDSSGYVGRIREAFAKKFKKRDVFLDLEIGPGVDFVAAIRRALSASSVLLVIIGPDWLETKDASGRSRLSDPEDYVRFEIRAAIDQGLRVIPVLVGGARMPLSRELPEGLHDFANLEAFELSNTRWQYDLARLVAVIRPIVDPSFRLRRICLSFVAVAALLIGVVLTSQLVARSHVEHAIDIARSGRVDEGLQLLKALENKKTPERTNPKIYLYEAEIYQMKGDAFYQNDAAEKAVKLGIARGDNFVVGRAKGFACDAKSKLGLDQALQDCEQAQPYSLRAKDPEGQVRAINFAATILKNQNADDSRKRAMEAYQQAMKLAQQNGLVLDEYGALMNIGLLLADRPDPSDQNQAKINIDTAARGFKDKKELGEESSVYNLFGALNLDQGKIDPARENFQKALELAIQGKAADREAQARLNLGLVLELTGSLDAAERELVHSLQIYEKLTQNSETGKTSETGDIAEVRNDLGDIYLQQARFDDARKAYADAARIRSNLHQTGGQALSLASLVNVDLEDGKTAPADLLSRIETAAQLAINAGDSYSQSFANVVKARLLLQTDKVAAEKAASEALKLAGDNQADNKFAAQIVLAEIAARNGQVNIALNQIESLRDSSNHDQNVGQSLEAQLTYLKLMKQWGQPKQRSQAEAQLPAFQNEAQTKGYKLLASKASEILSSST